MKVIRIGQSSGKVKPIMMISAGGHGNDSTAPAVAIFVAYSFITGYGSDAKITKLINAFDVNIIPYANPDGYHRAHKKVRLVPSIK